MANVMIMTAVTAGFLIAFIRCMFEKSQRTEHTNDVRQPGRSLYMGVFIGLLFLVIGWTVTVKFKSVIAVGIFAVLELLGILLMISWKNYRIVFDDEGFCLTTTFGFKRRYTYDQIGAMYTDEQNPLAVHIQIDKMLVSVTTICENADEFFYAVEERFRKTHNDQEIPDKPLLEKGNGFRAHVYNANDYILRFTLLFIIFAVFFVISIFRVNSPIDMEKLTEFKTAFSSGIMEEEDVILYVEGMTENFVIEDYDEHLNGLNEMIQAVKERKEFTVLARLIDPSDESPYYRIYAISDEDTAYRTIEDSNLRERESAIVAMGICGGSCTVILLIFGLYYAVGSNPKRYPEWLVYRLFKKDKIEM